MNTPPVPDIAAWHAHIYYDPANTRDRAETLRTKIEAAFPAAIVGSWHDKLVGPHTSAMFQIAFAHDLFDTLVPFLALNRDGLAILVHADSTGDHKADHTTHAIWMGTILPVNTAQWK
jgi:aromatic ring-cleaving dioxygenase